MVFIGYHERSCRFCWEDLNDFTDPLDHYKETHFTCALCDAHAFGSGTSLHQHYDACHLYCKPCKRVFATEQNLDAHLRSRIHLPATFKCPMLQCQQYFISPAAVVLHLESGKCASGVTRTIIDRYIVQHDRNNVITNPSRLITGPVGSRQLQPTATYIATERSWNGNGYECYFCHKEFKYLAQLNQHLASPKHTKPEEMIYRCPNRDCNMKKATLSGLCQHIESGSCGVNRFSSVTDAMDQFVSGMRRLRL
ncbi:hypothetical protein CALVIDRAFT_484868 [Calocera viscosa TUFC12733]|uniref:C2H2-type domain-containing protein n=1 Tax=Calocera viscosa (strain TUFC12733) TaxID=1330018 RepID=A0A167JYC7_CALVF|nr:hypothetical protein CALVIDRAFT_484868 [Calocera viscosa TUFC12733]